MTLHRYNHQSRLCYQAEYISMRTLTMEGIDRQAVASSTRAPPVKQSLVKLNLMPVMQMM